MSDSESLVGILIVVAVLALAVALVGGSSKPPPELTVERVHESFPEWSIEDCERVVRGEIWLGMTPGHVCVSLRKQPSAVNRSVGSWGVREQWVFRYPSGSTAYYYFTNDRLTSWQDSPL